MIFNYKEFKIEYKFYWRYFHYLALQVGREDLTIISLSLYFSRKVRALAISKLLDEVKMRFIDFDPI